MTVLRSCPGQQVYGRMYHRSPDSWYMSYSAYFTVAMANAIKTIFWPVFLCLIVCEVSNCRGNASLPRYYNFATASLSSRAVPSTYSTLQFFFPFLFNGMSQHILLCCNQQWSVFFSVWFSLAARGLTDTERRAGDRCREERTDLGKEIWYHVPGSAGKVSYNAQFFI